MYILFKKKRSSEYAESPLFIKEYRPTLFKPFIPNEEEKGFKVCLSRIWFWFITGGKTKVVYVEKDGKVIHTSLVVSKCFKFPFMIKGDYEIGPCVTKAEYRGQGVYPSVLNHITSSYGDEGTNFYMLVHETNLPSIRGVEKAGFERISTVEKSKALGKYNVMKKD